MLLIKHQLLQAELDFILKQVETREAFEEALHSFEPDIILADYTLPAYDGFQALIKANEDCPDVPFIFVTGTLSVEFAVKTLKQGAKDFVLKDQLSRLGQVVIRALEEYLTSSLLLTSRNPGLFSGVMLRPLMETRLIV